ncbi:MAG: ribonuclease HII [Candidatus Omnitrophica bacterium]|nr:ribonuclease HII [Candidatus Omnitrophota bacterium]
MRKKSKLLHERRANRLGHSAIAGVDEAGRGPLAGPVVAAALLLRDTNFKARIDDSKKLTPRARLAAYREIIKKSCFGIGIASEKVIDRINIYNATRRVMEEAIEKLPVKPDYLLIDGRIRLNTPHKKCCIVGGDSKSLTVACASIVAKVTRDRIMEKYHRKYPKYNFARHKGYGTKEHFARIKAHGPCPIHRRSFSPVKNLV